jgi:transcriptional regulator with XRE-family HTH domain
MAYGAGTGGKGSGEIRPAEVPTTLAWRQRMREAREAKGMSQEELARLAGMKNQGAVSKVEKGKRKSSKYVQAICNVLGIEPPQLLVRSELERRWIDAGRVLSDLDPSDFEIEVLRAEALADSRSKKKR